MTLLNYWHYISFGIIFLLFIGGVISALKQEKKKLIYPMIFSTTLISVLLAAFSVVVVDKYTKKADVFKLKNKRLLSTEQIVYTGFVKNEGNFPIGTVTLEIKLVNKGHATGRVKGGTFYKASGFLNFFTNGFDIQKDKPQTLTEEFVVARNLKAGASEPFYIHFRYPPYFSSTAQFTKVTAH